MEEHATAVGTRRLIQIVSGFSPDVDGMGDYAKHLSQELWRQSRIASEIVVLRTPASSAATERGDGWSVRYAQSATTQALMEQVEERMRAFGDAPVLLHYGPYAYTSDGLPLRFAETVRKLGKSERLAVFFHEMWAHGWPWRRAFWTRNNQRHAVQQLLACSRVAFSSSDLYLRWLQERNENRRPLNNVRIFSNIGEVERPVPLREREPKLVVFGQRETRAGLYRHHGKALENLCRVLRLEKIVDVGSGEKSAIPDRMGAIPIERKGFLSEAAASALMATSVAGVVWYWPEKWGKSGVLSSYQAHGMLPILVPRVRDGFRSFPQMPFALAGELAGKRDGLSADAMQAIADRAHAFYMREVTVRESARRVEDGLWGDGSNSTILR